MEGVVIRAHGGHYYVESAGQITDCQMRGRIKHGWGTSDLIAIGDRVIWSVTEPGRGIVESVLPRRSALSRRPPAARNQMEQVIVANPDLVLVVFSLVSPPINPYQLDRYLVACESAELPLMIVINKVDLIESARDDELICMYQGLGYQVQLLSTVTGEGVDELRGMLRGRLSVLTGPSGVGKSSLLNALWPELDLIVGEISEYHDRGKHTTVVARLLQPEPNTYVADTPGLRQFRLWDIDPEQLEAFFPEMRPYLGQCRFAPCTHTHEPSCAVKAAVDEGAIPMMRYESYCRMFELGF